MVAFLADGLCDFLPALLLLDLVQQNGLLGGDGLLALGLLLVDHGDVLVVALVVLARVHQLAVHLLPLLQEVSRLLQVLQLHLLLHILACPARLFCLERGRAQGLGAVLRSFDHRRILGFLIVFDELEVLQHQLLLLFLKVEHLAVLALEGVAADGVEGLSIGEVLIVEERVILEV